MAPRYDMRSPPAPLACTPIALRILRLTPEFRVGHAVTALQGGAHEEHVRPAGRLRFAVNVVLCGVYSDHSSAVGEHEPSHVGAVGVGFFFFSATVGAPGDSPTAVAKECRSNLRERLLQKPHTQQEYTYARANRIYIYALIEVACVHVAI